MRSKDSSPAPASADLTVRRAPTALDYMSVVVTDKRLSGRTDLAVAVRLAHYSNWYDRPEDGKKALEDARPGTDRLAADLGIDESNVRKSLKKLADLGWAERVSQGGRRGGKKAASVYTMTIPAEFQNGHSTMGGAGTPHMGGAGTPHMGGARTPPPEQYPIIHPSNSYATDKSEQQEEEAEDGRGLSKTYDAFESWAKATLNGDEWGAVVDLLAVLEAEHGEGTSDWAANYFSFSAGKARDLMAHERGPRYGAAKLARTLLSTANASGCAA